MNFLSKIVLLLLLIVAFSCRNEDVSEPEFSDYGHPRILLLKGEEQQIRNLIETDKTWEKVHFAILERSNDFIRHPVLANEGFLNTGHFMKHMVTPTGGNFTWSDCSPGTNLKPAMASRKTIIKTTIRLPTICSRRELLILLEMMISQPEKPGSCRVGESIR